MTNTDSSVAAPRSLHEPQNCEQTFKKEIIVNEPDTTTTLGSSPTPLREHLASTAEDQRGQCDKGGVEEKSSCERTISQSSAEMSGDGEYTAEYLGTLDLSADDVVLNELAANLTGLRRTSYMVVNEGDIKNTDYTTTSDSEFKSKGATSCRHTSRNHLKLSSSGGKLRRKHKTVEINCEYINAPCSV